MLGQPLRATPSNQNTLAASPAPDTDTSRWWTAASIDAGLAIARYMVRSGRGAEDGGGVEACRGSGNNRSDRESHGDDEGRGGLGGLGWEIGRD